MLTKDQKLFQLDTFQVLVDDVYEFMMEDRDPEDIEQILRDTFVKEIKELSEVLGVPYEDLLEHCVKDKFGAVAAKYKDKNNNHVFIRDNESFLQFWEENS